MDAELTSLIQTVEKTGHLSKGKLACIAAIQISEELRGRPSKKSVVTALYRKYSEKYKVSIAYISNAYTLLKKDPNTIRNILRIDGPKLHRVIEAVLRKKRPAITIRKITLRDFELIIEKFNDPDLGIVDAITITKEQAALLRKASTAEGTLVFYYG